METKSAVRFLTATQPTRTRTYPLVAFAIGVFVVFAVVVFAMGRFQLGGIAVGSGWPAGLGAQATPIHHYGAESGKITDTLISPDDVSLQIVQIQKGPTTWLFHIHAHDNAKAGVTILNTGTSHFFMLTLKGVPGTPYTFAQSSVILTSPAQADLAAHAALSATVLPNSAADGWLMADLSHTSFPPVQLMYVYGTVTAPACTNPLGPSSCHPSTGYRTIVWNL